MGGLVWTGFAAFFVVSLTVGVRLLALWRRTRQLPELLMGLGVLGIGPVGFGLLMLGVVLLPGAPGPASFVIGTASLAVSLGVVAKCTFNWRVYHPDEAWARAVSFGATAVLGLCFGAMLWQGFENPFQGDPIYYLRSFIQIGALLWGAGEALRYHALMRRRARLGLADPVVVNRFLLWGLGAGAAGVGSLVGTVAQLALGMSARELGWVTMSSSLHGLVAAIALWLAFLPPARWRRFVESRA